ncbi:hypothetical protein RI543_001108 [Arxiozyma heterogenica]|uniref:STAS domain-containing protein n=1 Tax=Arxiozyma heterogenica TaxID=278026 RepID=A0AAN7ZT36_9SACH|nr:hypothetical protein RI543_001108 [Kazachstania heterogenica]
MDLNSNLLQNKSSDINVSQNYGTDPHLTLINNKQSSALSEDRTDFNLGLNNNVYVSSINNGYFQTRFKTLIYYLPCTAWITTYGWLDFVHDFVAGLSLASFQIPLSISYASSLAHVDLLSGLYSLGVTPFVYAMFGSTPSMIVGPEAAISLVIGQNIESITTYNDKVTAIQVTTVTTFLVGLILFFCGIIRLGFMGSILSRALLRGFIGSVGFVMVLNSLIIELKLNKLLRDVSDHYNTPFQKIIFLIKYAPENYHKPTFIFSFIVLFILLVSRALKNRLAKKIKWIIFLPEILLVISVMSFISYCYDFKKRYGMSIVGDFNTNGFDEFKNPLSSSYRQLIPSLGQLSTIVATLGFFESITTSKGLGGINNSVVSSNRELIALGLMNLVGSAFGILPAFGGYGRSKINLKSGARTVISGVFMGLITLLTTKYFLPIIHYIPNCILAVTTTLVGLTLLEDIPKDILFHIRCYGYSELFVFFLTIVCTLFCSIELGIIIGCMYSIASIVKHSAKSRIQILAKIEGTNDFINVIECMDVVDYVSDITLDNLEGCLLIKITEPLTFTNAEDMKDRLDRVKRFGSINAHPGSKEIREQNIDYVIFDLHGMTYIDSSATQILYEIICRYQEEKSFVFLVRIPKKTVIRERLQESGIFTLLITHLNILETPNFQTLPFDPFSLNSVQEALLLVTTIKQHMNQCRESNDDNSVLSKILMNSNLV